LPSDEYFFNKIMLFVLDLEVVLIILFFFIAYLLGLVLMAQLFLGLHLIYLLEALSFPSTLLPLQLFPFVKVFHKDQSLDHSYSYSIYTTPLNSLMIHLSVIIYLLMTLNCSSPSKHLNSPPIFYTYKYNWSRLSMEVCYSSLTQSS